MGKIGVQPCCCPPSAPCANCTGGKTSIKLQITFGMGFSNNSGLPFGPAVCCANCAALNGYILITKGNLGSPPNCAWYSGGVFPPVIFYPAGGVLCPSCQFTLTLSPGSIQANLNMGGGVCGGGTGYQWVKTVTAPYNCKEITVPYDIMGASGINGPCNLGGIDNPGNLMIHAL